MNSFKQELEKVKSNFDFSLIRKCVNSELQELLNATKDLFKGEDCYVLACGPSLNSYSNEYLRQVLKDKLVFCIKQSVNGLEDICSAYFWNCCNVSQNKLPNGGLTVASSNYPLGFRISANDNFDIFFKVPLLEEVSRGWEDTILSKKNFNDLYINKGIFRDIGPGIFMESVLPFVIHFGCKKVITLGYDCNADILRSEGKKIRIDTKNCKTENEVNFHTINSDIECPLLRESSKDLFLWLKSIGTTWETLSKNHVLSDLIKTVKI